MIWVKSCMISSGKFLWKKLSKKISSFSKIKKKGTKQINKTLVQLKIAQNSINSYFTILFPF